MAENTLKLSEERVGLLETVLDQSQTINQSLREQLSWNAMLAGEDIGWAKVIGGMGDLHTGPSLDELKEWSRKLRESLGNVHMQRGMRLRTNNIWSGNIHYSDNALPSGSGYTKQTKKYVADLLNQRNFFGPQAHDERESALFTDSIYLVIGDPSDHSLEPTFIEQVGSIAFNPLRADEIIAYRIDYTDYSRKREGESVKEWIYTDLADKRRNKPGFKIKVEHDEIAPTKKVIFDQHVNTQVGWAFGAPDGLTAYAWAKIYRDFVMNGKVMSDAMAQFAFQIATGSKKETDNAAARIATPSDAGATLIGANALTPLPTAGKGYDFDSGHALLAIVASALEVSVVSISSNPGASGSGGYGSAATLDLPTRLAMESRRSRHVEFDRRVLTWMGAELDANDVFFSSLSDASEEYRELQALILALDSGLYLPGPIEERISELLEITGNAVPIDWIQPNTLTSLKAQSKIKAANAPPPPTVMPGAPGAPADQGLNKSTAAPDQGKNNPAGGSGVNGNDVRKKGISK
ncbi:hypothetical protein [Frigoribacterium sp. CG_9.8]|uniref:hypothetical protein n=1 Tax=Frigoribacterium sp. CG_9.8 TaxID=2787733 RepID=UPI0018CB5873|nr:hypothetical protein [Frigoribacterium sp. CG_9.8]MBG6106556.1 hypothetical protein [Frigoribacterium sp. CG_9.8]